MLAIKIFLAIPVFHALNAPKPTESSGFHEIVKFFTVHYFRDTPLASSILIAPFILLMILRLNPLTLFWSYLVSVQFSLQ